MSQKQGIYMLKEVPRDEARGRVEKALREVLDIALADGEKLGGFAIVVWDKELRSTCDLANLTDPQVGPTIPEILIPDFVRSRLLAEKIAEWTEESIAGVDLSDG